MWDIMIYKTYLTVGLHLPFDLYEPYLKVKITKILKLKLRLKILYF